MAALRWASRSCKDGGAAMIGTGGGSFELESVLRSLGFEGAFDGALGGGGSTTGSSTAGVASGTGAGGFALQ